MSVGWLAGWPAGRPGWPGVHTRGRTIGECLARQFDAPHDIEYDGPVGAVGEKPTPFFRVLIE